MAVVVSSQLSLWSSRGSHGTFDVIVGIIVTARRSLHLASWSAFLSHRSVVRLDSWSQRSVCCKLVSVCCHVVRVFVQLLSLDCWSVCLTSWSARVVHSRTSVWQSRGWSYSTELVVNYQRRTPSIPLTGKMSLAIPHGRQQHRI